MIVNQLNNIVNRFFSGDENSRALQLSGFIRFGFMILQGIILVKCGLDPYFIAIVESFYFLFNLSRFYFLSGGKYAGFSDMKGEGYHIGSIFWGFNLLGVAGAMVAVLLIVFGGADFSSFLQLDYVAWTLPLLVLLSLPVDSVDLIYIDKKTPKKIVGYTFLVSLMQMSGLIYLLTSGYHMGHVVLFFTALFVIRWIHLFFILGSQRKLQFKPSWLFAFLALPLILHSLFSGLTDYVDGWLIKTFFDDAAFAVYRYGARELPLNSILIGAVISGLILYKQDIGPAIKAEITKIVKFLAPILGILILISPWLFELVYSADYKLSALYFNLYALLIISHVLFVQVYIYRANDRWLLSWISLVEVICNVILSIILLNVWGIIGVPIATLIVDACFRLVMLLLVRYKYQVPISDFYPVKAHALSTIGLLACFYISYLIHY